MDNTNCGYIAIVGRPNVGKSTLMNHILGKKISITSHKPQTTRHQILGVKTQDNNQAVFVDTPGFHLEEKKAINRYMNRAARSTFFDVDLIVFLIEGTRFTDEDENVLKHLKKTDIPIVLAINKIDKVKDKKELLPVIDKLKSEIDFKAIMPISALRGQHTKGLLDLIFSSLPEGPFFFDKDQLTDRNMKFQVAEIIREKIIRHVSKELPYETTVEIEKLEQSGRIYDIHALIWVEKEGQKAILIGKKGEKLKEIGISARRTLENIINERINLKLWVKVKAGWSDSESMLNELGIK